VVKLLGRDIRPPEGLYLTQHDPSVVAVEDGWYSSYKGARTAFVNSDKVGAHLTATYLGTVQLRFHYLLATNPLATDATFFIFRRKFSSTARVLIAVTD